MTGHHSGSTRRLGTPSGGKRWARRVGTHLAALAAGIALANAGDSDPPPYRPVVPPTITVTATPSETAQSLVPPEQITPAPEPDPDGPDDTFTTAPTRARLTADATRSKSVYYASCAAARQAGAAPLHRGEPGYRAGLDRDHDGEACE